MLSFCIALWIPLINHCTALQVMLCDFEHDIHCTRFDLVCWFESYPLWVCFNIKVSPTEIYKILKQFESWNRFCFSFILNTLLRALLKLCKSISKCLSAASLTGQHFFFVTHFILFDYYYYFFFPYFYITYFIHRKQYRCTVDHRKYLLIGFTKPDMTRAFRTNKSYFNTTEVAVICILLFSRQLGA